MFVQICCAVEVCFMKTIVHRDIKKQNLLLDKDMMEVLVEEQHMEAQTFLVVEVVQVL